MYHALSALTYRRLSDRKDIRSVRNFRTGLIRKFFFETLEGTRLSNLGVRSRK